MRAKRDPGNVHRVIETFRRKKGGRTRNCGSGETRQVSGVPATFSLLRRRATGHCAPSMSGCRTLRRSGRSCDRPRDPPDLVRPSTDSGLPTRVYNGVSALSCRARATSPAFLTPGFRSSCLSLEEAYRVQPGAQYRLEWDIEDNRESR